MQKNDISHIFSLLSGDELAAFGNFLKSPYFNVPDRLIRLFNNITRSKDDIIAGKISRQQLASGILKSDSDSSALRKLFSDFNRALEKFLVSQYCCTEERENELSLARVYREKGFTAKSQLTLQNLLKQLKKLPSSESKFKIMAAAYEELNLLEDSSQFHKYSPSLEAESDYLDAYFIGRKLYLYQLMHSKEKLNSTKKYNKGMYAEIMEHISENTANIKKNYPDIYLKYLMLNMLGSAAEEQVIEYREYLESAENTLSHAQLIDFYSDLYNYLTIRISEGDHFFRKPLLGLYKILDSKGLLYDSGKDKIHLYTFKQAADTALHLNDIKWAEYFVKKYADSVNDPIRKNIVNLLFAKINCFKGEPKAARINLAKVDYRDFIHYLDSKLFLFCMEYDASNFDEAELLIASTLKYLKHNKELPELNRNNSKMFLRFASRLLKLKTGIGAEFELQKLKDEFNAETGSMYARNWLKDKLNEFRIVD
ncbi:MAG TPA: hypothetical protein PK605_07980 [Ignavibacteria bacterium]|nr:hypothetical protein [Bacteroidota bacterium]HRE11497.1 hypothetical protein [Ignavibacteria bacterium]HRF66349.1 hypothetical protein [Ignavibacteria bacterium]HRJ04327.1 hypothetical protein [Ignavibacteria bacterium]